MARPSRKKAPEESHPQSISPPGTVAQELGPAVLAEAILARTIRPRAADLRRLAEAFLAARRKPDRKKKKKASGKKRKLSKIPGQKDGK